VDPALLAVVYTVLGDEDGEIIRLISARKADTWPRNRGNDSAATREER
jgi:uncharacterized DUF497 family protein